MSRYLRYAILIPLSVVAFYVLFVLPDINLGWFGGLALLAGSWCVWYLLWAKPMTISNLMMFGLIASSALEYSVTGVAYWRDRH